VTAIQLAPGVAVHGHPDDVASANVPFEPAAGTDALAGETV
jgi:hypothetical protein